MLDYILSRLMLLIFLLLIVGTIVSYKDFLGDMFASAGAKSLVLKVGEKIRSIALSLTVTSAEEAIRLPSYIRSGPVRLDYNMVFGCNGSELGIGVKSTRGNLLYFKTWNLKPSDRGIKIRIPKNDVEAGDILYIKKSSTLSEVTLTIKPRNGEVRTCQAS